MRFLIEFQIETQGKVSRPEILSSLLSHLYHHPFPYGDPCGLSVTPLPNYQRSHESTDPEID